MPQLLDKTQEINTCGQLFKILFKAESSVKANAGKPQLYKHAREMRALAAQMLTIYLNQELVRVAEDGAMIQSLDVTRVFDVMPMIKKWMDATPATRDYGWGNNFPNSETTLWLCTLIAPPGHQLPPFTDEAKEKIVHRDLK